MPIIQKIFLIFNAVEYSTSLMFYVLYHMTLHEIMTLKNGMIQPKYN